jgi:hypothetical protein
VKQANQCKTRAIKKLNGESLSLDINNPLVDKAFATYFNDFSNEAPAGRQLINTGSQNMYFIDIINGHQVLSIVFWPAYRQTVWYT